MKCLIPLKLGRPYNLLFKLENFWKHKRVHSKYSGDSRWELDDVVGVSQAPSILSGSQPEVSARHGGWRRYGSEQVGAGKGRGPMLMCLSLQRCVFGLVGFVVIPMLRVIKGLWNIIPWDHLGANRQDNKDDTEWVGQSFPWREESSHWEVNPGARSEHAERAPWVDRGGGLFHFPAVFWPLGARALRCLQLFWSG